MTFLLAPIVERLQRWHMNRGIAVIFSVALAMLIARRPAVRGVRPVHRPDEASCRDTAASSARTCSTSLGALRGGVSGTTDAVEQMTRELSRVAPRSAAGGECREGAGRRSAADGACSPLRNFIGPLIRPLSTAALVIVFVIFMLLRLPDLRDRVISLLGSKNLRVTTEALDDAAKRVSQYLVMQTVINGWQGCWRRGRALCSSACRTRCCGARSSMALRFIPYIGIWVAAALPRPLSFAVFDNWIQPALVVAAVLRSRAAQQHRARAVALWQSHRRLADRAAGRRRILDVALGAGRPVARHSDHGVLVVMGKYIPQLAFLHVLLGDQPVLLPHERLYQRLLASNRDEADDLLEDALREQARVEVCDTIILPALRLAQDDHDRGSAAGRARAAVFEHIERWTDEFAQARDVPRRTARQSDLRRVWRIRPVRGGRRSGRPDQREAAHRLAARARRQGARWRAPTGARRRGRRR